MTNLKAMKENEDEEYNEFTENTLDDCERLILRNERFFEELNAQMDGYVSSGFWPIDD